MPKKRKAAEASSAKIKQIAEEYSGSENESDGETEVELPISARPKVQRDTEKVEDMPTVGPGLRLWERFTDAFEGFEIARLANVSCSLMNFNSASDRR